MPRGRNGFWLVLFSMFPCLQGIITQVKEMETSSIRLEKDMEVEADRSARRKIETKAEMRKKDPLRTLEGKQPWNGPECLFALE